MRSKVIWSFLSLVALSAAAAVSGCDSDATVAKSGEGESCDSSYDCAEGLNCIQNACYKTAPDGGEGGEPGVIGPTPPVLGGEGESCSRRADCKDGLACFNQRCAMDLTGEGGGGNVPTIRLGQLGETCTVSSDCDSELACLPGGQSPNVPVGFVGVCSNPVGQFVPSGKSCGAECVEDTDCCELPVILHEPFAAVVEVGVPGHPDGTGANSCAALAKAIGDSDCATAVAGTALAAQCFAQTAYCECDETWTCEAGRCSYAADCDANGSTPGGCPSYTRSGAALSPFCDSATGGSDKCQPPEGVPVCEEDADCDTKAITDVPGGVCAEGECVCYQESGCYRACNSPLDCAPNFTCDEASSVCVPVPACSTDVECQLRGSGPNFACVDDACERTCGTDYDCNSGSYASGINTLVCNAEGLCEAIGCVNDDQCTNGAPIPVKMFCVDNAEPSPGGVASAITD